jgi:hypothetical protein
MKKSILLFALFIGTLAFGEQINKLPRVAELEDTLRTQASNYIRSRFPEQPFLVSVSVEPVRRIAEGSSASDRDSEALPYFDSNETKIMDEWDDPGLTTHQLLLRTKKVSVEVNLSDSISDTEKTEIKEALFQSLHLVQARDEIKVETRKWSTARTNTWYLVFGLSAILIFLIGLSIIQRTGYQKLASALSNLPSAKGGSSTVVTTASGSGSGGNDSKGSFGSKETTLKGGVEVSDPVLARKIMSGLMETVKSLPSFPTLNTMVALDRYGKNNPEGLGALMHELPGDLQKTLFSLSNDSYWLKAMIEPGIFGMEQLNFFQRLIREATQSETSEHDRMLIHVWRLGPDSENFLRSLNRGTAFAILSEFPKDIAIPLARKAFPGAWADLVDPDFKTAKISETEARRVMMDALKVRPATDLTKLSHYRREIEILEFLKNCSIEAEREVYGASKPNSGIHQMRAPFFVILDGNETILKDFVLQYNPYQWSVALWDASPQDRKKIEGFMFEKQKYLFQESIKGFERNPPDLSSVSQQRERMAATFRNSFNQMVKEQEAGAERDSDEKQKAA